MRNILIALLFFPVFVFAQKPDTAKLLTASKTTKDKDNNGWIYPWLNWHYIVGDNPKWAKPEFDDSAWQVDSLNGIPYSSKQIPEGSIIWMRIRIKNDSSFSQPLVMRLYQSGASEIYLDGKLIHRFGVVSPNPDSAVFYNPGINNFALPLINDSTQLLAVRFLNMPVKYPIFLNPFTPGFYPRLAMLTNAEDDYQTNYNNNAIYRLKIVFGAAFILSILFLSLFLFFRAQKVNLLFSMCTFCLAAGMYVQFEMGNPHKMFLFYYLAWEIFSICYLILFQFCIYKIFNQALRWQFKTSLVLALVAICSSLILNAGNVSLVLVILVIGDSLRIISKTLKTNKSDGARILQVCMVLNLMFWFTSLLSQFPIFALPNIYQYTPFAFLLNPVGLAIYIGYSFGTTSQSLRQKLIEVEQLSNEKQQILALQNETLEKQVTERTAELNFSLLELKSTQSQLIQSEKMASLGELTAGIAHEIQNPLNFVNNFSEVNKELVDELTNELNSGNKEEAISIARDIKENEEKINHHGKRADAIVKGMLQHSQTSKGQKEPTDINALCDEYLRLAYHGLRAKDKNFNATLQTDFDNSIGGINIVPQDIGRVILNLIANAFYAVDEKKTLRQACLSGRQAQGDNSYEPTVYVKTSQTAPSPNLSVQAGGRGVIISVTDNGNGIPASIKDKIFQPFFTTKPTGQGTGLGLSLAYDIVNAHGGEIKVESKDGEGTTFIIQLHV